MSDCPNAEIRDRLPDLVHERLDATTRVAVLAHVEGCALCRAELALLRELHTGLSRAPTFDAGKVARAVVSRTIGADSGAAAPPAVRPLRPTRRWADWRIAAAIAVLAVGGASLATIRKLGGGAATIDSAPRIAVVGASAEAPPGPRARPVVASEPPVPAAELSMAGGVADLSESDLRALLADIQELDAVPEEEPEPVAVRVAPLLPAAGRGSSE